MKYPDPDTGDRNKKKGKPVMTAAQNLAMAKANRNRMDAAGRTGMGETGKSNMAYSKYSPYSNADRTANDAYMREPGSPAKKKSAFIKSWRNAASYAVGDPLR